MKLLAVILVCFLFEISSAEKAPTKETRDAFGPLRERITMLGNEFELLARQLKKVFTDQVKAEDSDNKKVEDSSKERLESILEVLQKFQKRIDTLRSEWDKMVESNSTRVHDDGNPGLGSFGNIISGFGNPMGMVQEMSKVFTGLAGQLQGLTKMLGNVGGTGTGTAIETDKIAKGTEGAGSGTPSIPFIGGTNGSNPFSAIITTLTQLTNSLQIFSKMFEG